MPLRDVLTALFVVTVLGTNFVAIKVGLEALPPLLLSGLRFLLAAVPAVFLIRPPRTSVATVVAYGGFVGVLQFGLLFTAIRLGMPAGLSSLVMQLQVFFTIGLAFALMGERPSRLQVVGALVAMTGVVVIGAWRAGGAPPLALLLVVLAALSWSSGNIVVKKAGSVDMLGLMVWSSLVAAAPLLALSLLLEGLAAIGEGLARATWSTWAAIAYIAYPTTLLAFALWNRLLGRYPAATVMPFALLIPVAGIGSTSLLLAEPFGPVAAAGAALVLAGLALNVWSVSRPARAAPRVAVEPR